MEVAPFFVDFHHFLSIFTIFYRFSRFTHFCRDLHFVAIYALFPQFFLAKIAISATSHVFCMYGGNVCYINLSMSEIHFQIWRKKVAEVLKMRFTHCEKHIWLCAIQNIHRFHSFMHSMINPLLIVREPWKKSKTRQQACKRQMPLWKKNKLAKLCIPC